MLRLAIAPCPASRFHDLEVLDAPIELDHHRFDLGGHYGGLGIRAGELRDRLQRLPSRDDEELDAFLESAPMQRDVDEAGDFLELRKGRPEKMPLVGASLRQTREAAPVPRNHRARP